MFNQLSNIDPTPTTYSTDTTLAPWLEREARRIRRERREDILNEIMLGLFAGVAIAWLLVFFRVI